jgi:hypothetical protein
LLLNHTRRFSANSVHTARASGRNFTEVVARSAGGGGRSARHAARTEAARVEGGSAHGATLRCTVVGEASDNSDKACRERPLWDSGEPGVTATAGTDACRVSRGGIFGDSREESKLKLKKWNCRRATDRRCRAPLRRAGFG